MKLKEGRIGIQEGVCILGIVLLVLNVFTLYSKTAYESGNTSYIWLPGGALLAAFGAALLLYMLKKTGAEELCSLYMMKFGGLFGRIALTALALTLAYQAFLLQDCFANALNSYVFQNSRYSAILFWVVSGGFYIAWGGLERIARSAKCVGGMLGVILVTVILIPAKAFALFRLFPFPGEAVSSVCARGIHASFNALPAMLCLLSFNRGLQGVGNTRRVLYIGAAISTAMIFLVQFVLGLTYVSEELQQMLLPMFRIDMSLLVGNYQFRQDKATLFLWLMGAMPAAAYLEYGAAFVFCRLTGIRNIRLPLLAVLILICAALTFSYYMYPAFTVFRVWMERYGIWLVWPFALVCIALCALRVKGSVRA